MDGIISFFKIILIIILITTPFITRIIMQLRAFKEFKKDISNHKVDRSRAYKILRITWFVVEVLAMFSIIILGILSIYNLLQIFVIESDILPFNGFLPFEILLNFVLPTNILASILWAAYAYQLSKTQIKER